MWATAAACVACVAVLVLPAPRAFAQRLWDRLFLGRVEVVRINFDDLPAELLRWEIVGWSGKPTIVADASAASRTAGFEPRLPRPGILRDEPKLFLTGSTTARIRLSVRDLEAGLRSAGASEVDVPPSWEGATLAVRISPILIAEYPEISLTQSLPIAVDIPAGFEMVRFLQTLFRIAGMEPRVAAHLSEKFAVNPTWFLGIPQDEAVEVREVQLASGPGMLIEDFDDAGQTERIALVWNAPDRIYAVSGKISRELAVSIANSIR
jgi:hypothetical protein